MTAGKGIKVIVTMIGLDGHTTGAETVSMVLRDAGFEVIYLGCNQTPEMIVDAAMQEDVDVVGISSHASNYDQLIEVVNLLRAKGMDDVPVICGGNIPRSRFAALKSQGVAEIFAPGSTSEEMVSYIAQHARQAHSAVAPTALRSA